jgi:hypothetical protein
MGERFGTTSKTQLENLVFWRLIVREYRAQFEVRAHEFAW